MRPDPLPGHREPETRRWIGLSLRPAGRTGTEDPSDAVLVAAGLERAKDEGEDHHNKNGTRAWRTIAIYFG